MKKKICIFLFSLFSLNFHAQNSAEDTLKFLREKVLTAKNDSERVQGNNAFIFSLEKILQSEESYKLNFDSVKYTGILSSPDHAFRIINWNLPFDDETNKYYCYIQSISKKTGSEPFGYAQGKHSRTKKIYQLFKLTDKSEEILSPENKILNKENWFGALYYQIIPAAYKGKTYYTLLGWDGNNSLTRKKIIDVLYFDNKGEPKFGADIFRDDKSVKKRVIFEYSAQVAMSVKYYEEKKQIIFDHLSPSQPELEGMFQYYGPDFSYDAYQWEKGKWIYKNDVDARMENSNPVYNPEIKNNEKPVYQPKN